ncbi:MAG: lipid-A-disaccharide synthase [Thermodesulfobacteriota bacterium]
MKRVMISAGEASGDLHGSNLARAVKSLDPEVEFYGLGGRRLREAGTELLVDLEHTAVMGLTEVLAGLGQVFSALRTLKAELKKDPPAAVVLIDYPDFNLRLARAAHRAGVPVFYYICPQIWAWRIGRLKKMAELVDRRVVVFPFEKDFYESRGLGADFVGHPLLDIMAPPRPRAQVKAELGFAPDRNLLLMMPGSRRALTALLAPVMFAAAGLLRVKYPDLQLAVSRADTLPPDFLDPFLEKAPGGIRVLAGDSHALQNAADAALIVSGTSTVETALMLTPMVVAYRMSRLTYFLGRMLVRTDHIAMANLIAGERVAPELIQDEAAPERMAAEVDKILSDGEARRIMIEGLGRVRERLGGPGASRRAAGLLLETMSAVR